MSFKAAKFVVICYATQKPLQWARAMMQISSCPFSCLPINTVLRAGVEEAPKLKTPPSFGHAGSSIFLAVLLLHSEAPLGTETSAGSSMVYRSPCCHMTQLMHPGGLGSMCIRGWNSLEKNSPASHITSLLTNINVWPRLPRP